MNQHLFDILKDEQKIKQHLQGVLGEESSLALRLSPATEAHYCQIGLVRVLDKKPPIKTEPIGEIRLYKGSEEVLNGIFIEKNHYVTIYIGMPIDPDKFEVNPGTMVAKVSTIAEFKPAIENCIDLLIHEGA